MASSSLADLTPDTRQRAEAFLAAAAAAGFQLAVVSTLRTCADQGKGSTVVVQGMTIKSAPGCKSWHVFGRAFDVVIKNGPTQARYAELGALGKSMGLMWGGDFASNYDPIHFQYTAGKSLAEMCPDPNDCEAAVKAAVAGPSRTPAEPSRPSVPSTTSKASASGPAFFVLAMLVGWWAARRR